MHPSVVKKKKRFSKPFLLLVLSFSISQNVAQRQIGNATPLFLRWANKTKNKTKRKNFFLLTTLRL